MATNRIETLDPALIRPGNDEQTQITHTQKGTVRCRTEEY